MTSSIAQPSKDVLEAEVPSEIMEQFKILQNALKQNDKLAQDFLTNSSADDDLQKLDNDLAKLVRLLKEMRASVRKERMKNHALSEQVARDGQMAEQVHRRHELLTKNPQYGRAQSIEYMHSVAGEHEQTLFDFDATITRVEKMLQGLMGETDESTITEADFSAHIHRFDEIFEVVASQTCGLNEEIDKLKDAFLEHQRKIYGRYASNPFERRKERQKMSDAFSNLKGLDAFPSQHAVLSMSEFLPRQQAVQAPAIGAGSAFGSTGMFGGAKPTAGAPFSLFSQPAASTAQPFGITSQTSAAPSLFGQTPSSTAAAAPLAANKTLFGGTPLGTSVASQPTGGAFGGFGAPAASTAPLASSTFGNTMSSATSGTLFRGSAPASTIGAPPTKSLFGNK